MHRKFSFDLILVFLFVALFLLYFHNASRDIYGGDVGDLTTAACVGGVPHPPGFPLFSLVGFGFCRLSHVFPIPPVLAVGMISVLAGTLTVCMYYLLAREHTNKSIALFSSLTLAFTYLFWLYSELAEVFVLNAFFAVLLFFLAEKFRKSGLKKDFLWLCFTGGLSLTNHQTIIFIFPAIFLLVFSQLWSMKKEWKTLGGGLLLGLLGFSLYGYSVIASLSHPALDWAHITNVQSFLDMLLRKRYGTFSAGVFDSPTDVGTLIILKTYFISLLSQMTFPAFVLCLIGIDRVIKIDRVRAISYALGFLLSGPLFFGYAGFPLISLFHAGVSERFLILSTVIFLLFLPYGCQTIINGFLRFFPRKSYGILLQGVLFLIPFLLFVYNYPKTNLAPLHYGEQIGKNFLASLPKNAVVLMDGDTTLFNTWYVHLVLHFRPDVIVMNMYSLYDSPYYMSMRAKVKKEYPKLSDSDLAIEIFKQMDLSRPFFSRLTIQPEGKNKLTWVPYGLVHDLRSSQEPVMSEDEFTQQAARVWGSMKLPDIRLTDNLAAKSLTLGDIPSYYANALLETGNYFQSTLKNRRKAYYYYAKAKALDPTYARTYAVLGVYFSGEKDQCSTAQKYLQKSIELDPNTPLFYFHLYTVYRLCSHDTKAITAIEKQYQNYFRTPLEQDLKKYLDGGTDTKSKSTL
jgi:4-amino-4-deoxy-L-arabinose transferase-like glycosyltransferase